MKVKDEPKAVFKKTKGTETCEEVIESDEYGEAVFDAEVIYPEVNNLCILQSQVSVPFIF